MSGELTWFVYAGMEVAHAVNAGSPVTVCGKTVPVRPGIRDAARRCKKCQDKLSRTNGRGRRG